jgi:hypothetical protein
MIIRGAAREGRAFLSLEIARMSYEMDPTAATLFNLAQGIAEGRVGYTGLDGVPAELVAAVRAALDIDIPDTGLIPVARLILRAMAAMRAIDLRDAENGNDFGDCAAG